jgi:hypothetical protein
VAIAERARDAARRPSAVHRQRIEMSQAATKELGIVNGSYERKPHSLVKAV